MARRAGKLQRSPARQRRLERRRQSAPQRERLRELVQAVRDAAADYDELCRASFGAGEWIHAGWVACRKCGFVQPYRHAPWDDASIERYEGSLEVELASCMRGEFLDLPCSGEVCETIAAYEEAA